MLTFAWSLLGLPYVRHPTERLWHPQESLAQPCLTFACENLVDLRPAVGVKLTNWKLQRDIYTSIKKAGMRSGNDAPANARCSCGSKYEDSTVTQARDRFAETECRKESTAVFWSSNPRLRSAQVQATSNDQ